MAALASSFQEGLEIFEESKDGEEDDAGMTSLYDDQDDDAAPVMETATVAAADDGDNDGESCVE